MSHHPTDFKGDIIATMRQAITDKLDDVQSLEVAGGGGHFTIDVTSADFEGKRTLQRHRLVLTAIAHLMAGDAAPVHAIDSLKTNTP